MENEEAPSGSGEQSQKPSGLKRRAFLGAMAAASSALLLEKFAKADDGTVYYEDSFGNVVPVSPQTIAAGVYPPPVQPGQNGVNAEAGGNHAVTHADGNSPTVVQNGYTQPNILVIMVDQMRAPRWLPPGGQPAVDALLPSIGKLRSHSWVFPNYFVAAVACTPSRATFLTGLYSQQTCMFRTQGPNAMQTPDLNTGFPTFATALTGVPGYKVYWIGKWHLSDAKTREVIENGNGVYGPNGPVDYGFSAGSLNFPPSKQYASPNGYGNLGTEGYNVNGDPPLNSPQAAFLTQPSDQLLNDPAICDQFINNFPFIAANAHWCVTVSFVNPHDITSFPYAYALTAPSVPANANFGPPSPIPQAPDQQHPQGVTFPAYGNPTIAGNVSPSRDLALPALPTFYDSQTAAPPADWGLQVNDNPYTLPYNGGAGKPSLQLAFQNNINITYGSVVDSGDHSNWLTFLNYYFWMQQCVDAQVGRVIATLRANASAWANTVIVFTADHGEYGGSHSLKAKGGAAYEEAINVPLYISFPSQRANYDHPPVDPYPLKNFVCSSVDILPFLYTLSLGNNSWRTNPTDVVNYLSNRESIYDGIFSQSPMQRRVATNRLPNKNGSGYQAYVLHTTDEFPMPVNGNPSHVIAYRSVDLTVSVGGDITPYISNGGGKLGMYSFWPTVNGAPVPADTQAIVKDPNNPQQFEFYDYTGGNLAETGNSFLSEPTLALAYQNAFNDVSGSELYVQYPQVQAAYNQALVAYFNGVNAGLSPITDIES